MQKLVLSLYSGVPNLESGPNKIVYELLQNLYPKDNFDILFISKNGIFTPDIILSKKANVNYLKLLKSLLGQKFFRKSYIYRSLFNSDSYLDLFFSEANNKLATYLSNIKLDIYHSHDIRAIPDKLSANRILLTIHSNGSIVNDMKNFYGDRPKLNKWYEYFREKEIEVINKADYVVFPSYSAAELFQQDTGLRIDNSKLKVIYNGIDIDLINRISIDTEFLKKWDFLTDFDLKIFNVANHVTTRNVDKIVDVAEYLRKTNVNFIVINVGSGFLTSYIKKKIKENNLEKRFLLIPYLKNEDVIRFMKFCDIYLSLSQRVIFDIVIIEALASGSNIIALEAGCNREAIKNGINGILVKELNPELIAETILNFNHGFMNAALETAKYFSVQNMVKKYLEIYNEKN